MTAGLRKRRPIDVEVGRPPPTRDDLEDSAFAFPKERKEPLHDAAHVRNAIARFDQVDGVADAARDDASRRNKAAAKRFDFLARSGHGGGAASPWPLDS